MLFKVLGVVELIEWSRSYLSLKSSKMKSPKTRHVSELRENLTFKLIALKKFLTLYDKYLLKFQSSDILILNLISGLKQTHQAMP